MKLRRRATPFTLLVLLALGGCDALSHLAARGRVLVRVDPARQTGYCDGPAYEILAGRDRSGDGALGDGEAEVGSYACVEDGVIGEPLVQEELAGAFTARGTPRKEAQLFLAFDEEPAGKACRTGGFRIAAGADENANLELDADEATATWRLCNSAPASRLSLIQR